MGRWSGADMREGETNAMGRVKEVSGETETVKIY